MRISVTLSPAVVRTVDAELAARCHDPCTFAMRVVGILTVTNGSCYRAL